MIAWATAALAGPGALPGTWALEIAVVTESRVPVLGALRSTSRTWVRAVITDGPAGLVQDHVVCGVRIDAPVGRMEVPAAYVAAIPPRRYPVTVTPEGDAVRYDADTQLFRLGWDDRCATVPETPDAPCVVDADADGQPGATVHVSAPLLPWVDVYVAQQTHLVLHGVAAPDRVEGRVEVRAVESRVLGASQRLFAGSPRSTPSEGASTFAMVRLPDDAACAAVLAAFGR